MRDKRIWVFIAIIALVLGYFLFSIVSATSTPVLTEGPAYVPTETPTEEPAETSTKTPAKEPAETVTESTTQVFDDVPTEAPTEAPTAVATPTEAPALIDPAGSYTSRDDVALYIHTYGKLPGNFITKKEAQALGWSGGGLEEYAPGKCIGGDYFGNYEGLLPDGNYHECDIDTLGKSSRGAKRIIYDSDGDIYYTSDHYESFTQLY